MKNRIKYFQVFALILQINFCIIPLVKAKPIMYDSTVNVTQGSLIL